MDCQVGKPVLWHGKEFSGRHWQAVRVDACLPSQRRSPGVARGLKPALWFMIPVEEMSQPFARRNCEGIPLWLTFLNCPITLSCGHDTFSMTSPAIGENRALPQPIIDHRF